MLLFSYYFTVYKKEKERRHAINHYKIPDILFIMCTLSQISYMLWYLFDK